MRVNFHARKEIHLPVYQSFFREMARCLLAVNLKSWREVFWTIGEPGVWAGLRKRHGAEHENQLMTCDNGIWKRTALPPEG